MIQVNPSVQAQAALAEINELLKSPRVDNNHLLTGCRIDHKTDLEQLTTACVVFGAKAFSKLVGIMNECRAYDCTEFGTYFYGRALGDVLYIEKYSSDFAHSDGIYQSGAVEVTYQNFEELRTMTERTVNNPNPYNIVMHVHTHPDRVKDAYGNTVIPQSLRYSENDLYSYGYQQLYLQPKSGNPVVFLGLLIPANYKHPQIHCVFYDVNKQNFVNLPNIFYRYNNINHKFNNDDVTTNIAISKEEDQKIKSKLNPYEFYRKY